MASASVKFAVGSRNRPKPAFDAPANDAMAPRTARMRPSNINSPIATVLENSGADICPSAARIPRAMGKSNAAPSLRMSAGARFTVMAPRGNSKSMAWIAARMRSIDSRTAAAARPTTVCLGIPRWMAISMQIGGGSSPLGLQPNRRAYLSFPMFTDQTRIGLRNNRTTCPIDTFVCVHP